MCSLEVWILRLVRAVEGHLKSGMLRACGYFSGGLKSQHPHLMVGLHPHLKNCRLNLSSPFFSSVEWISSRPVTLLNWGPEEALGRELDLQSLACS